MLRCSGFFVLFFAIFTYQGDKYTGVGGNEWIELSILKTNNPTKVRDSEQLSSRIKRLALLFSIFSFVEILALQVVSIASHSRLGPPFNLGSAVRHLRAALFPVLTVILSPCPVVLRMKASL